MSVDQTPPASGGSYTRKVDRFTASGNWVCPAGVTYAIAHIYGGGGGGAGADSTGGGGASGASSSAFGVSSSGGAGGNAFGGSYQYNGSPITGKAAQANTFQGGSGCGSSYSGSQATNNGPAGHASSEIIKGLSVTPGTSYAVVIGAGGAGGSGTGAYQQPGGAGGSGYVWIEYQV